MTIREYEKLIDILQENDYLIRVFDALEELNIKKYYVGAGAISQSIWNYKTHRNIGYGISDIDIVIFNADNLDKGYETELTNKLLSQLGDFPYWLDVKNQARVHLWYKEKFGFEISPYIDLESAINTWPTTASSIGVRKVKNKWEVYAPFGIGDLMNLRVVANNRLINEAIYIAKQDKWKAKWQELTINEWDDKTIPIINSKNIVINR